MKTASAFAAPGFSFSLFHIMPAAVPMSMYNVVHTGGKIHAGGVNEGFVRDAYHVGMEDVVNIEPSIPAARQTIMETAILVISI